MGPNKPTYLIVHHTGGSDANPLQDSSNFTFIQCNDLHRDAKDANGQFKYHYGRPSSFGYYVGYHYYIEKDGKVYQARADLEGGTHTVGHNNDSIGICLAGNFDATLPTKAQENALRQILELKIKQYSIPLKNIVPHRKFAIKTCFGRKLTDDWAQKLVSGNVDTVTPLRTKLNGQLDSKDWKGARDTASLLFTELGKL